MTCREITPIRSNSTSLAESTLAEIPLASRLSSLNRRGESRRYQMMCGFQAPPTTRMHSVSGHSAGGGATLDLRIGTDTVRSSYWQVTRFFRQVLVLVSKCNHIASRNGSRIDACRPD